MRNAIKSNTVKQMSMDMSEIATGESRLTKKNQVTVTKEIREALNLESGDEVRFIYDGRQARIVPKE